MSSRPVPVPASKASARGGAKRPRDEAAKPETVETTETTETTAAAEAEAGAGTGESARVCSLFPADAPTFFFHSKAADPRGKYLSNFTPVPTPVAVDMPDARRLEFATVEAAFHAHKMYHLVGGVPRPDLADAYAVGGVYASAVGAAIKASGGKKAFKTMGVALDRAAWDAASPGIMRRLLRARAAVDPRFCHIAMELVGAGFAVHHFVRNVCFVPAGKPKQEAFVCFRGRDVVGAEVTAIGREHRAALGL
jgi:hypothetical protein